MDMNADEVALEDTDLGAEVAWDVDRDAGDGSSVPFVEIGKDDLRQSDFIFNTPQFAEDIND